jgi:hypothetical protein
MRLLVPPVLWPGIVQKMHSRLHFYRHDFSIDRDIVKIAEVKQP